MTLKEKENMKASLKNQIQEMRSQMSLKNKQISGIIDELAQIRDYARSMTEAFRKSQFHLIVAQKMEYDSDTQFQENNTTQYLAELEEYIAMLITYTAYSQDMPDAAVSALSLEKMIPKRDLEGLAPINVSSNSSLNRLDRCAQRK